MRELAILVVLAVMLVATQIDNTSFLSEQGIKDLLLNATILVLVAVGEAVVVITGNVDLSVGSVLGVTAFAAGDLLQHGGNPVPGHRIGGRSRSRLRRGQRSARRPRARCPRWWSLSGRSTSFVRWTRSGSARGRSPPAGLPSGYKSFGHNGISAIPYLALLATVVLIAVGYFLRELPQRSGVLRARFARSGRGAGRGTGAAARAGGVRPVRCARRAGRSALPGPFRLRRRRDRQRL